MSSFTELNENLPEYNLIDIVLNYSGKVEITEYKKLRKKYKNNTCHFFNENIISEFIISFFQKTIEWRYITIFLKKYNLNNMEFIEKYKSYLDWDRIICDLDRLDLYNDNFIKKYKSYLINSIKVLNNNFNDKYGTKLIKIINDCN